MTPHKRQTPSHSGLEVEFSPGEYQSSLKSRKAFKSGEILTFLQGLTRSRKAYSTLQCGIGPDDHVELNSDFLYVNHSCDPNIAFDLSSSDTSKWHVRALRPIADGDRITCFYPSTEWEMDQPFQCECGTKLLHWSFVSVLLMTCSKSCLGVIRGARYLSRKQLSARGFINSWILTLAEHRDKTKIDQPVASQNKGL
ncbi:LOW QUALITY PROTEIN: hypothetical protein CVT26_009424 [Gymnopilus dilepis]|uniref:SET domain-containing protein n=1 Tax=Gymnopilus dilepis TaxID=231916 RepID=A0A409VKA3_9AGAR|nr:LOW QUALITY PROTEIN: hypothetical protein CVT26_009424 [Gymnopilus dilepis]